MSTQEPVLVLGRDGWCRAKKKKTLRYQESVATACGYLITAPYGFKKVGNPTCPDCSARRDLLSIEGFL